MTNLEKELSRQIHELDKEIKQLRERVAVLESRTVPMALIGHKAPAYPSTGDPYYPPSYTTCEVKP